MVNISGIIKIHLITLMMLHKTARLTGLFFGYAAVDDLF
jgi:hypothetical protein